MSQKTDFLICETVKKIICAGFPKTGTKTLYECLKILGFNHFEVPDMACHALNEWKKETVM